jgi:hypothetical protein
MAHNQIEFFPAEAIKILPRSIKFGSGSELLVSIRHLRYCKIEQRIRQQGRQHIIQDNDNHDVGELWFDGQSGITAEDCVVVGIQGADKCLILLVSKAYHNRHRRIGAGEIMARHVSEEYRKGMID